MGTDLLVSSSSMPDYNYFKVTYPIMYKVKITKYKYDNAWFFYVTTLLLVPFANFNKKNFTTDKPH